ncbi:hypothetical protein [Streptosporangium sp. NPDC004631]
MAFKDFAVGEILTSSDVDTYLMRQVVIGCTSSTRPASPSQGMHIYETDTNKTLRYTGSVWEELGAVWKTYTPVLYSAANVVNTSNLDEWGRYRQSGNVVEVYARIIVTTTFTGSGSEQVAISAPVNGYAPGTGRFELVSAGWYPWGANPQVQGMGVLDSTNRDRFKIQNYASSTLYSSSIQTATSQVMIWGTYLTSA